ncbi:DUF5132 domain-containing protein [Amorphus sp. 3PC139-8]|uniref:DUF5132 domain-containing protein n=1 Tax=Amorphus sp. 3PC139-8 TaxID=2735676 RepID=UPI00345D3A18
MLGRGFLLGAAVAAGGLLLIPGVAAATARAGRPLARSSVKYGTAAYLSLQKAASEAYEHFEDMAAEVRAEMHSAAQEATEAASDAASDAEPATEQTGTV